MRYFDHDTTAGTDDKIMALRLEHGSAAIDVYWTLLEKMYADEKPLNLVGSNLETKSVLHRLNIGYSDLETYVGSMLELGLFQGSISDLKSERAMANIADYQQKVETARQNGKKGGRKPKSETEKKPSRFPDGNQTAKLRKEKKGIETYSVSNPVPLGGAERENPAPQADETSRIINEIDAQYAEWSASTVPCPNELNPFRKEVDA